MRGNAADAILIVVLIVGLFMGGMLTLYVWGAVADKMEEKLKESAADPSEIEGLFDGVEKARVAVGKGIMFIIFILMAVSMALAYLTPAHPILMAVSFILGAFAVILSVIGKQIIDTAIAALPALASQIPGTVWFWNLIPVIIAVYVVGLLFLLYYGWASGGMG